VVAQLQIKARKRCCGRRIQLARVAIFGVLDSGAASHDKVHDTIPLLVSERKGFRGSRNLVSLADWKKPGTAIALVNLSHHSDED